MSWLEARRKLVAALTVTLELIPSTRLGLEIDAVLAGMDREARLAHANAMPPLVSPKAAVLVQHLQGYKVGSWSLEESFPLTQAADLSFLAQPFL